MINRGFTLIELLISLSIVGLVMGLILVALGGARAAAREMDCQNRLHQVSLAVLAFEGRTGHLPNLQSRDREMSLWLDLRAELGHSHDPQGIRAI